MFGEGFDAAKTLVNRLIGIIRRREYGKVLCFLHVNMHGLVSPF